MRRRTDISDYLIDIIKAAAIAVIGFILIRALLSAV